MQSKQLREPCVQTQQEAQLIALYRNLPDRERQAVLQYFEALRLSFEAPQKQQQTKHE